LLALYEPPLRAKATRYIMQQALDLAEKHGAASTKDLTAPLIAAIVAGRPPAESPRTTHQRLRAMRCICRFAVQSGWLRTNPFDFRPVSSWIRLSPPRLKPFHSREEIRAVLALMQQDITTQLGWAQWRARRLLAVTTLAVYTGLRRNELLYLHVEDLDLAARVVWVRNRHRLKCESAAQPVPLPAAAVPVLTEWLEHRLERPPEYPMPADCPWLFPTATGKVYAEGAPGQKPLDRLKNLGERAGVKGFTFHSLRRSLATHMEMAGYSQPMITRILRHTSERTSRTYYQGSDLPALARAVEGFTI
jgi:integrase